MCFGNEFTIGNVAGRCAGGGQVPQPTDYSRDVRKPNSAALQLTFAALGLVFLVLGTVGIFIPVVPTVPLWLVSAACFARSSVRVYNWLLNHAHFGPSLREWRHHRSIPWRAKVIAVTLSASSFAVSIAFLLTSWPARAAMAIAGTALCTWLWRLPSRDRPSR